MTAKLSPRLPLLFFFLGLLPFSSMAQYSPTQHLLRRRAGGQSVGVSGQTADFSCLLPAASVEHCLAWPGLPA
jgi:hypothetical protein